MTLYGYLSSASDDEESSTPAGHINICVKWRCNARAVGAGNRQKARQFGGQDRVETRCS